MSVLNRRPNPYNFHPSTSIPPLTSRVILVTGANAGIGLQSVLQLSVHSPSKIYLACRSRSKYDAATTEILKSNPKGKECVEFLELDLSAFGSIKTAAKKVLDENDRLDILINNAGIMGAPPGQTKEGYESHFGVNYLGHALLTKLLLPLLQRTASRSDVEKDSVRVVNVSSLGYTMAPQRSDGIDLSDATIKSNGNSKHSYILYGVSKLANIWFAKEAARRWSDAGTGVVHVSVHPGRVNTGLLDGFFGQKKRFDFWEWMQKGYDSVVGTTGVEEGSWPQVWCATWPMKGTSKTGAGKDMGKKGKVEGAVNGAFYVPVGVRGDEGNKKLNDERGAGRLWEWMEAEFRKHGIE